MPETRLVIKNGGKVTTGAQWVEVRDAASRTASTRQTYPAPNANSAKAEKS